MTDHENVTLAAVGDRDSILVFNTLGFLSRFAETPGEAEAAIRSLAALPRCVIFVTEPVFSMIPELVKRYKAQTFPVLIPIPNRMGSDGTGLKGIQENVKKAVGFNIFDEG